MAWVALRYGRPSFVAACWLDRVRAVARRLAGRTPPTLLVSGVAFAMPGTRRRDTGAFYRDRVLRLRYLNPSVAWPYPRLICGPDPMAIPSPAVLATFHMGSLAALGALLERLPAPVSIIRGAGQVTARRSRYLRTSEGEAQRVAAVIQAIHTLRQGGFVLVVADGPATARVEQILLGRPISLPSGAFALARLSGAVLVPVAARWRGAAVEILAGDPIPPAPEATMASALVGWLERYLRDHPEELTYPLSRLLGVRGTL